VSEACNIGNVLNNARLLHLLQPQGQRHKAADARHAPLNACRPFRRAFLDSLKNDSAMAHACTLDSQRQLCRVPQPDNDLSCCFPVANRLDPPS
jgi:hypothetical protein